MVSCRGPPQNTGPQATACLACPIAMPLLGTQGSFWQGAPEEACQGGILYLGTILCPATSGKWEVVEPGPGKLSPVLPGAERLGEKHTDEASATSVPLRPVREELDVWGKTRVDSETSLETQTDPLVPGQTPSISAPPPQDGASIPRASAPVSTGCLLLHCGPPGCKLLEETATSLGTTGEFGTPVCKVDVTVNPPGDLSRRPPMCCLSGRAHGGPWDLLGNSWEQEIQPTSPDSWCAMRDDDKRNWACHVKVEIRLCPSLTPLTDPFANPRTVASIVPLQQRDQSPGECEPERLLCERMPGGIGVSAREAPRSAHSHVPLPNRQHKECVYLHPLDKRGQGRTHSLLSLVRHICFLCI